MTDVTLTDVMEKQVRDEAYNKLHAERAKEPIVPRETLPLEMRRAAEEGDIKIDLMLSGFVGPDEVQWLIEQLRNSETELKRLQDAALGVPYVKARDIGLYDVLADQGRVFPFDEWHHAPMCPANHYHRQRQPTGPCRCGAAFHQYKRP